MVKKYKHISFRKKIYRYFQSKTLKFFDYCDYPEAKETEIDILIPVAPKDAYKLELVLNSLKKNLQHRIKNIYVVSRENEEIKETCQMLNAEFVNEDNVLPINLKDINYFPKGTDRRGWIFQQLLKLSADGICASEDVLVVDSDTIFARPQSFKIRNKVVFDCSNEYHKPYWTTYQKLLGEQRRFNLSFVAHHMFFQRNYLKEMKQAIEQHCKMPWWQAILKNLDIEECSSFSEYETYGNYMYRFHRDKILLRYWHNCSTKYADYLLMTQKQQKKYKTISMHSYNEN